jgi:hypothetical protein
VRGECLNFNAAVRCPIAERVDVRCEGQSVKYALKSDSVSVACRIYDSNQIRNSRTPKWQPRQVFAMCNHRPSAYGFILQVSRTPQSPNAPLALPRGVGEALILSRSDLVRLRCSLQAL